MSLIDIQYLALGLFMSCGIVVDGLYPMNCLIWCLERPWADGNFTKGCFECKGIVGFSDLFSCCFSSFTMNEFHPKIGVLLYIAGMRSIIMSSNLAENRWKVYWHENAKDATTKTRRKEEDLIKDILMELMKISIWWPLMWGRRMC